MRIIVLIFSPVILGICLIASNASWHALPIYLKQIPTETYCCTGMVIAFLLFVSTIANHHEENAKETLLHPWLADLTDAQEATLPDGKSVIKTHGRYFVFSSDRHGATVQEYNKHGKPISNTVTSDKGSWRFGKSPEQEIAEYTKAKINDRQALPSDGEW